jgi:hypothetical protein
MTARSEVRTGRRRSGQSPPAELSASSHFNCVGSTGGIHARRNAIHPHFDFYSYPPPTGRRARDGPLRGSGRRGDAASLRPRTFRESVFQVHGIEANGNVMIRP